MFSTKQRLGYGGDWGMTMIKQVCSTGAKRYGARIVVISGMVTLAMVLGFNMRQDQQNRIQLKKAILEHQHQIEADIEQLKVDLQQGTKDRFCGTDAVQLETRITERIEKIEEKVDDETRTP